MEGGERGEEDVEAQNKCSYQFHFMTAHMTYRAADLIFIRQS